MNKISYGELKKVLSPKEMKNILGGSGGSGSDTCGWKGGPIPCHSEWSGTCSANCIEFWTDHCFVHAADRWCDTW